MATLFVCAERATATPTCSPAKHKQRNNRIRWHPTTVFVWLDVVYPQPPGTALNIQPPTHLRFSQNMNPVRLYLPSHEKPKWADGSALTLWMDRLHPRWGPQRRSSWASAQSPPMSRSLPSKVQ